MELCHERKLEAFLGGLGMNVCSLALFWFEWMLLPARKKMVAPKTCYLILNMMSTLDLVWENKHCFLEEIIYIYPLLSHVNLVYIHLEGMEKRARVYLSGSMRMDLGNIVSPFFCSIHSLSPLSRTTRQKKVFFLLLLLLPHRSWGGNTSSAVRKKEENRKCRMGEEETEINGKKNITMDCHSELLSYNISIWWQCA